jgi:putative membrane protein
MWDRFGPQTMDHGWWPGMVGDLVPLLFLIVLLAFGIWAVRRITEQHRMLAAGVGVGMPVVDGALEELRLRYARGDLDRDGYVQRLHDLGGDEPEPPPPSPPPPPDAA